MKRFSILSALIVLCAVALVSCKPEEKKEWSKFYGYTSNDLVGDYAFSNASNAFANLIESDEGHLCEDAEITVTAASAQTITFRMESPRLHFVKVFTGRPTLNQNTSLINMYSSWSNLRRFGLTSEVLKNDKGDIRLQGFISDDHYERVFNTETGVYDTLYEYSIKYYFDVIKN